MIASESFKVILCHPVAVVALLRNIANQELGRLADCYATRFHGKI
jgi:hypothetical protein